MGIQYCRRSPQNHRIEKENPSSGYLSGYNKGLRDGGLGVAFDPSYAYQADEREGYKDGFKRAREEPRL